MDISATHIDASLSEHVLYCNVSKVHE